MGNLYKINVVDNEVVKAADIQNGNQSTIDNVTSIIKTMIGQGKNLVIGGKVLPSTGMTFSLEPIIGFCFDDNHKFSILESDFIVNGGSIENGYSVKRIDTIEVGYELEGSNEQQRAFIDFSNNTKIINPIKTQTNVKLVINIKSNPNDGTVHETAPETTKGFIKLAEIEVPANAISIGECTINNCEADYPGLENTKWSNEKTATFNFDYLNNFKIAFRKEHEKDGTHKENVIHSKQIDFGVSTESVNSTKLPLGKQMSFYEDTFESNTSVSLMLERLISSIANKLDEEKTARETRDQEITDYFNAAMPKISVSGNTLIIGY